MSKNFYSLQLTLSLLFITFTSAFQAVNHTSDYNTAIINTLPSTDITVFKLKTGLAEGFSITKLANLEHAPESFDLHKHIMFNRDLAKRIHKSWLDDLISVNDAEATSEDMAPIYNYIQVSYGKIYTKSNPKGYIVTMDTGSSHAVLPLSYEVTYLSETYRGIYMENHLLFNESIYYGRLVECPELFKNGLYCTSASYVSDASNSVVGTEFLSTGTGNVHYNPVVTEYKLNLLRGHNADLKGIFGIGFGLRGFVTSPFLRSYYSTTGPQNILFTLTTNATPTTKGVNIHEAAGSIKINTSIDENDFKWVSFDKRGLNYSLNVMYGIYITTEGKPGVYDMDNHEFNAINEKVEKEGMPEFGYGSFMFDSGTNGFILDQKNALRVAKGLDKIYGNNLILQEENSTAYACWPDKHTAKRLHLIPPTEVYMNILLEGVKATVSLEGMTLFDVEIGKDNYNCTYAMIIGRGVQILGYPAWKKLDLVWDSNGSRVGIRNGVTNE